MPYLKKEALCPEPLDCRILTAALDLFVENSYHNVSVHHIQKHSGVSIGSIYKHFGGKEGIAKALYRHLLNELDEVIRDIQATTEPSPSAQCQELIRQLFSYTETHRNIIAFLFYSKHTEFLPHEKRLFETAPFIRIREIIQQGIKCGEFKETDLWVATAFLFGGAIKMIQLRLDNLLAKPLPDYSDEVIQTAWPNMLSLC